MIINKRIHITLALAVTINLLYSASYAQSSNSADKSKDFYLPKSSFSASANSTKKSVSVSQKAGTVKPDSKTISKPVIKEKIKSAPVIKPKVAPVLKPKTMPEIKPKVKTNVAPISKPKTTLEINAKPEIKSNNKVIKPVTSSKTSAGLTNIKTLKQVQQDSLSKLIDLSDLIEQKNKPDVKSTVKQQSIVNKKPLEPVISLSDFIGSFNASYSNTFTSTLYALSSSNAEILSFNSLEGKIYARLYNRKDLYILVHTVNDRNTSVRITPTDGVYNIPNSLVKEVFTDIKRELIVNR